MRLDPALTVAALVTPSGRGAVATIIVRGPEAVQRASAWIRRPNGTNFSSATPDQICFARWGEEPAEEVVVARRATVSSGDPSAAPALNSLRIAQVEHIEIHCHGGRAASERILQDLAQSGCQIVDWQTLVAAEAPGSIELEARLAMAEARTERVAAILLDQWQGALRRELLELIAAARQLSTSKAPPSALLARLAELSARAELGTHLTRPWRVTLAGPPNVGKSSLTNALLGFQRTIVFDMPGTTRDVVTALTAWDGWPVELSDTAGLGNSSEPLERASMAHAQEQLMRSDLVLLVFDRSRPWTADDENLVNNWPGALCVFNKCDLSDGAPTANRPRAINTSAVTGDGINELAGAISMHLVPNPPSPGTGVPFTLGQQQAIADALAAWKSSDWQAGTLALERLL